MQFGNNPRRTSRCGTAAEPSAWKETDVAAESRIAATRFIRWRPAQPTRGVGPSSMHNKPSLDIHVSHLSMSPSESFARRFSFKATLSHTSCDPDALPRQNPTVIETIFHSLLGGKWDEGRRNESVRLNYGEIDVVSKTWPSNQEQVCLLINQRER